MVGPEMTGNCSCYVQSCSNQVGQDPTTCSVFVPSTPEGIVWGLAGHLLAAIQSIAWLSLPSPDTIRTVRIMLKLCNIFILTCLLITEQFIHKEKERLDLLFKYISAAGRCPVHCPSVKFCSTY